MTRKMSFLLLLCGLLLAGLTSCTGMERLRISQDRLPWNKQAGKLLFSDDFSSTKGDWEAIENAYELKAYVPGGYRMTVKPANGRTVAIRGLRYKDSTAEVSLRQSFGASDAHVGLVCRYQDPDNYYALFITPDSYAGIMRVQDGQAELISGDLLSYHEAILPADGLNRVQISCVDRLLTLMVNGQLLLFAEDKAFTSGDIGLYLESNQTGQASVLFSDFKINKP